MSTSHLSIVADELIAVDATNATAMGAVAEFYQRMNDAIRNPDHRGSVGQLAALYEVAALTRPVCIY